MTISAVVLAITGVFGGKGDPTVSVLSKPEEGALKKKTASSFPQKTCWQGCGNIACYRRKCC